MPADTAAVINGSAHCGGKCDGCAKISPMNVATALIVACRVMLSVVRSICARRATVTAAPTIPQTEARSACSKLERGENVAARHHKKAGKPRPCELFSSRAGKAARAQIVVCEDTELGAWHRLPLSSSMLLSPQRSSMCDTPPGSAMNSRIARDQFWVTVGLI
jgi:hypothetical protein